MEHHINFQGSPLVLLKKIFEGTSEFTGQAFFRSLVKSLAQLLDAHGVWVTEYDQNEHRLNALAFWLDGQFVDKYEYKAKGTPCEPVLEARDICHIPENVIELFPEDPDLPPMGAVSYMGLALKDEDGKVMGHLALLDNKPMREIPEVFMLFKLFASRAAAEMSRLQYERRLQEEKSKTSRLLNGTMDAILELNTDLQITQVNSAALNIFQSSQKKMTGTSIEQYLEERSFEKIKRLVSSLDNKGGTDSTWIQGYLECMNSSNESFPADGTVSSYFYDGKLYYALYLRDVQDRINKEEKIRNLTLEATLLHEQIADHQMSDILGESEPIRHAQLQIEQVAPTHSTVLILGETGTGKELVAREIHRKSTRSDKPFIALNCAALPAELIESELFGHVKGAFTGATGPREGRFLLADKGTLFLDEVGELPLSLQAKLLRVIQEGEFEPVGSSVTKKVNVRIVAATHKDLSQEVNENRFRADLFYRLNVFPIVVPPLRARGNDIILLAETFLNKYVLRHGRKMNPLKETDKQLLMKYSWPGNVRELQNIIERAVITSMDGNVNLASFISESSDTEIFADHENRIMTQKELQELEIGNLVLALRQTDGKIFGEDGAARLLGIPPTTFCSKMKKYSIRRRKY